MEFYILAAILCVIPGLMALFLSYTMPIFRGIHIYEYYPFLTGIAILIVLLIFKYFVFSMSYG